MIGIIGRRFFHTGQTNFSAIRSSALGKLRKSTGYSVSNCKKAIDMFPDDISKAEEWLHAEAKQQGWAKWAKIQTRSAMQGLVGVCSRGNLGVMVEVNCETDFVAKNAEFQHMVENILTGCMNHISEHNTIDDVTKVVLEEAQLNQVNCSSTTVSELVNAAVMKFNEKTVAKRAVCFKIKDNLCLNSVSHPTIACPTLPGAFLGKYGTLLAYKKTNDYHDVNTSELSLNICQHIIGMNPSSIGIMKGEDILRLMKKANSEEDLGSFRVSDSDYFKSSNLEEAQAPTDKVLSDNSPTDQSNPEKSMESTDQSEEEAEGQDTLNVNLKDTDETRLLFQPFIMDSNVSVGELLFKSGMEVVDYERFECGEVKAEEAEAEKTKASA